MKKRLLAVLVSMGMMTALTGVLRMENITANAASRSVNIEVNFGKTEIGQYGVPGAFLNRFEAVDAKVSEYFLNEFDIEVNFINTQRVVDAPMDVCKDGSPPYTLICTCVDKSSCSNSGPYHHTNAKYNLTQLFPNYYTTKLQLHMVANPLCWIKDTHMG